MVADRGDSRGGIEIPVDLVVVADHVHEELRGRDPRTVGGAVADCNGRELCREGLQHTLIENPSLPLGTGDESDGFDLLLWLLRDGQPIHESIHSGTNGKRDWKATAKDKVLRATFQPQPTAGHHAR